jgi:integrase
VRLATRPPAGVVTVLAGRGEGGRAAADQAARREAYGGDGNAPVRVPVAVIAAWIGHRDASLTMRLYAHSQDDALQAAGDTFNRV